MSTNLSDLPNPTKSGTMTLYPADTRRGIIFRYKNDLCFKFRYMFAFVFQRLRAELTDQVVYKLLVLHIRKGHQIMFLFLINGSLPITRDWEPLLWSTSLKMYFTYKIKCTLLIRFRTTIYGLETKKDLLTCEFKCLNVTRLVPRAGRWSFLGPRTCRPSCIRRGNACEGFLCNMRISC